MKFGRLAGENGTGLTGRLITDRNDKIKGLGGKLVPGLTVKD